MFFYAFLNVSAADSYLLRLSPATFCLSSTTTTATTRIRMRQRAGEEGGAEDEMAAKKRQQQKMSFLWRLINLAAIF